MSRRNSEIYTGGRTWECYSLTQTAEIVNISSLGSRDSGLSTQVPVTTAFHPLSQECFHTACLFLSSFMTHLWGLDFLELCWHWLLLWFSTVCTSLQDVATSSSSGFLLWSFPTLRLSSVSGSSRPGCCRLRNHWLLGYRLRFSSSCCCCFIFTSFSKLSVVVGLTTNQSSEWTVNVIPNTTLWLKFFLMEKTLVFSSHKRSQCTRAQVSFKTRCTTVDSLTTLVRTLIAMILFDIWLLFV